MLYMEHIATISSKGQITLPAEFRRQLKLASGDKITIVKRGNIIEIKPNDWKRDLNDLQQVVAQHLKRHHIKPLSDEELDAAIDASTAEAAIKRYHRSLE